MTTVLLDVNLLIALLWPTHEHHEAAHHWFQAPRARSWATCPLTQLAFVRIVSNPAFSKDALAPRGALALLEKNLRHPRHEFWPDDLPLGPRMVQQIDRIHGHRQLTDAYLLGLARAHGGKLASFDAGIRDVASPEYRSAFELVPTRQGPRA